MIIYYICQLRLIYLNITTGKVEGVSSEMFAEIRNDKDNWELADNAFIEFRDFGPRGVMMRFRRFKICCKCG
jgi:hypothetical protein